MDRSILVGPMASSRVPAKPIEPLFPRLPPGSGGPGREQAARHQRGRMMGAMVEVLARQGYSGATVDEVVALAGISKRAFYEQFASKQECFEATFDEVVEVGAGRIRGASRSRGGLRERLEVGLSACAEILATEPAAAQLVLIDSLALGAAGEVCRERAWERFELMLRQSFAAERREVSPLTVRAIVGGLRRVAFLSLRSGQPEMMREQIEELVDWMLCYRHSGRDRSRLRSPLPRRRRRGAKSSAGRNRPPALALGQSYPSASASSEPSPS